MVANQESPRLTLIDNIGELITCGPLAARGQLSFIKPDDIGRIRQAWLVLEGGKVKDLGPMPAPSAYQSKGVARSDAGGALLLPGLIDSHTHPLFAGARFDEFAMRLNGATYQEIAAKGGGIQSTVKATREASDHGLTALLKQRAQQFLAHGVTTLEVKSGYGLSLAEELRHLRLLRQCQQQVPQRLRVTCLALHAQSPDYPDRASYIAAVCRDLLPELAREKLADYVDAFIEEGYFSVADCEPYIAKARDLGLGIRLHADEFSDAGAAAAAARWGAASADHLQFASAAGIAAMAKAKVVATLLPGTSLYTNIPFANGRRFAEAGCPVAVASDFNPGSCLIGNLPMLATLAGLHGGLNLGQIVGAVTYVAAYSLGLQETKGALAPGFDGDFLLHPASCVEEWLADLGQRSPRQVWIAGQKVWEANPAL